MLRCLRLLTRLMQGEAERSELVAIIEDDALNYDDRLSGDALSKRFNNDLSRLRANLGVSIHYDRAAKLYRFDSLETTLIDLPPDAMRGLAFLKTTFMSRDTPSGDEVCALIDRVIACLSPQRASELARMTGLLELDLHPRDSDAISDDTWEKVWRACSTQRQVEFDYTSKADDRAWHRIVEPQHYYFHDGHYYMDGRCLYKESETGLRPVDDYRQYRIGRIENLHLLPNRNKFPPMRPRAELIVQVRAFLVRQGVPRLTPEDQVVYHENGEATISTRPANIFVTLRHLLRYGGHVRVIGDEDAVEQMRALIGEIVDVYEDGSVP